MNEVNMIEMDFEPGWPTNIEIGRLLNYDIKSDMTGAVMYCPRLINQAEIWNKLPNYSENIVAAAEHMEFQGRVPYLKPIGSQFLCFFDWDGKTYQTRPYKKASHAFANALLFVLRSKSALTCI